VDEGRRRRILGIAELYFAQQHPEIQKGKGRKRPKPTAQRVVARRTVAREMGATI
jgi:hypothetical protein